MKGNSFLLFLSILIFANFVQAAGPASCEINFVRYINGELPADVSKNPMINMWDERFDHKKVVDALKKNTDQEVAEYITELSKLIYKNGTFNDNLSSLVTSLHKEKRLSLEFIEKTFINRPFKHANFTYSKVRQEVVSQLDIDPEKVKMLKKLIDEQKLEPFFAEEYYSTLLQSDRTLDDIEFAFKNGMILHQNQRDLEQFKKYIEFIDNSKDFKARKALANINKIYNYADNSGFLPVNPVLTPHKQFLKQVSKLDHFEARRIKEIERGLKLQMESGIVEEIDEAIQREANGYVVRLKEKLRFKQKIDEQELSFALKQRAKSQARHERSIMRRLMNGCNRGSSQRIAGAKKKFSRFKFALTLGMGPAMYVYKNREYMDKDEYFWEKLGHEVVMGVFFTYVGNKLITNTSTSFFRKYLEGYVKFGALSYLEATSYDILFGSKSAIRYFQKLYRPQISESQLEQELEELKNSETFDEDMKALLTYLEEMSKKNNTKNFLEKYLNLGAYNSLDDDVRITQEDLESEEAREMVMELLAERIYLQNMGSVPFFQTGSKANDRFLFYRARNMLYDLKGILLNLAIFEIMCREPFGKIGSWGAIIGLVFANNYFDGSTTYPMRREAINQ